MVYMYHTVVRKKTCEVYITSQYGIHVPHGGQRITSQCGIHVPHGGQRITGQYSLHVPHVGQRITGCYSLHALHGDQREYLAVSKGYLLHVTFVCFCVCPILIF